jgi:hypothetical protein
MHLKKLLLKAYGRKLMMEYGKDNDVLDRFFSGGNNLDPKFEQYSKYKIVHGHFLANRFDDFKNVKLITFLREPSQRVVSNYYFFKKNFYEHSPICHLIKEGLTLDEYVDLESSKNVQSFFMANKKVDDFAFIGILEEYEKSIALFKKMLDVNFDLKNEFFYYRKMFEYFLQQNKPKLMDHNKFSSNKNTDKKMEKYEISHCLLNKIKENNDLDYCLYSSAKEKFNMMKKKYAI